MSLSITKRMGIYSNTQFENVCSKVTTISSSIVTILMLFFGGQSKIKMEGEREFYVKASGYLGMIYATAALFDAKTRPRLPGFRIFGEISIICSYISVWLLIYAIFEHHSIPFLAISSVSTFAGYFLFAGWVANGAPTIFGCKSDPRLAQVIARLGRKDDLNSVLHMATLIGILFKPDVPETADLFKAVLAASPEVIPGGGDGGGGGGGGGDGPPGPPGGGGGGGGDGDGAPPHGGDGDVILNLGQGTETGGGGGSTSTNQKSKRSPQIFNLVFFCIEFSILDSFFNVYRMQTRSQTRGQTPRIKSLERPGNPTAVLSKPYLYNLHFFFFLFKLVNFLIVLLKFLLIVP